MRWFHWLIIIVVVLWIVHHTTEASQDAHNMGQFLSDLIG